MEYREEYQSAAAALTAIADKFTPPAVPDSCPSRKPSVEPRQRSSFSVGTVGDARDKVWAKSVISLFKTEVADQIGPSKSMRKVACGNAQIG